MGKFFIYFNHLFPESQVFFMKICGIVAEYNPFHNGHARHLSETRALLGQDAAIVCAMSGDFVQRGEPAVFAKHPRAEAAVRCGADLVLELPLPWCMAPAEIFARGAVSLLAATGIVTELSFGSECGDTEVLRCIAAALLRPEIDPLIRKGIAEGESYAAARQRAAETLAGEPLPQLAVPNDILGVEYCKAIARSGLPLTPHAIRREGDAHDAAGEAGGDMKSGLELRRRMAEPSDIAPYVPSSTLEVMEREAASGRGPVFPGTLTVPLLARLRMLPQAAFAEAPDAGGGLENRLFRAAREEPDLVSLYAAAAAKRYPLARIRRMLWVAALGLRREDSAGTPPYLRVLAANSRGRELLARMRKTAALPVLTKPAAARQLDAQAQRLFALGADAADFYALSFSEPEARRGSRDWRSGPAMLEDQEKNL